MGEEAGHSSSGRRKRKAKLMRAPWDIMTVPYCPLGAVTAGAQWSHFLPHARPPGVNGHPCTFHELCLLPTSPLSVCGVPWDPHGNPPFHQSLTSALGEDEWLSLGCHDDTRRCHCEAVGRRGSKGRDTGGTKGGSRHPREVASRANCPTAEA